MKKPTDGPHRLLPGEFMRSGASKRPRALIGLRALANLYRRRLRVQAVQELLAGIGVAVAVALVFATLVANSSIAGSAGAVLHEIVGPATLQLRARGPERLPAVKQAAPVLEQNGSLYGRRGRQTTLQIVGADVSLATLNGLAHTLPISTLEHSSLALTTEAARELSISTSSKGAAGTQVVLRLRGRSVPLKVGAVLGTEAVGAISRALVAVMPLAELQRIAGLEDRVTRILVQPKPGLEQQARRELQAIAGVSIIVASTNQDLAALHQALRPSNQASSLFAVIATLLGFLFAFNAMLLTAPARRRAIADFRLGGARRSVMIEMVLFQALCLGIVASLVGGLVGYILVRAAFHERPGYLAQAFTLGGGTVIGVGPLLLAMVGGVIATLLASAVPLLDLRSDRALDAIYLDEGEPGHGLDPKTTRRSALGGATLLVLAAALFLADRSLALITTGFMALAAVLLVPFVLSSTVRLANAVADWSDHLTSLTVALRSLRATPLRSLALMATGAVALFGAVALGGARSDLLEGLQRGALANAVDGKVLVLNPGDTEQTTPFVLSDYEQRVGRVPGVARVWAFQSTFTQVGTRRVFILARPAGAGHEILRTQIIDGNITTATSHLGERGWVAISRQLANELDVRLGGTITLPTPAGNAPLRVAAITTNLGWPGGSLYINTADYAHYWLTAAPTALVIQLASGVGPGAVQRAVAAALGPQSGLEAITMSAWAQRYDALAGAGLGQLAEISTLLALAAILALTAAVTSAIWQRRLSLSGLRLSGVRPPRLRRILAAEVLLVLTAGCVTGVVLGVCAQVVVDGYLKHVTGFPISVLSGGWQPLEILAIVMALVFVLAAAPGWSASRVSPALALADE
jgi:putative ABC transport system permease protein